MFLLKVQGKRKS